MSATEARAVIAVERRARALQLRKEGASFDDIAAELGMSRSAAHKTVQRGLVELTALAKGEAEGLRALELARLDELQRSIWPEATGGNLPAMDRLLKIMERRTRLLGLDAPIKHTTTNPDGTEERPPVGVVVIPQELGLEEWLAQYAPAELPAPVDAPQED